MEKDKRAECSEGGIQILFQTVHGCEILLSPKLQGDWNFIQGADPKRSPAVQACRLANDNGYLSWCRNTYLSSAVGVAMIVEGQTPIAEYTGDVTLLVAALNMFWGTWNYIYILIAQRHRVQMSMPIVVFSTLAAVSHLVLWICVIFMFAAVWKRDETKPV